MDRKKKILALLMLVLAVSVVYRITHPFKQGRVEKLTYTGIAEQTDTGKQTDTGTEPVPHQQVPEEYDIFLDLFDRPPKFTGKVNKNLFSTTRTIESSNRTDASKPRPAAGSANSSRGRQAQSESVVDRELGSIRFFGFYADKEDMAIFLKRGKDILVVREGDKIDGKYLVEKLTLDTIILKADHIRDVVHIDLNHFLSQFETARLALGE